MLHTSNYMWLQRDSVGGGATGDVFKGYNKNTGEMVAIKVPRSSNRKGFEEYQQRELDVLRRFNHRNIVRLIAVEKVTHGPEVIVMEYCNGGSLFSMLREPQNVFGFDDHEFLTVLHDIASGMEKLRNENVIHRDIKPGNIMRCIGLDGKTVYKLIDFDAARELLDEEKFQSIYGTEEYLHPQMYNRIFMDNYEASIFPHSVDLWSIGATLYHVAAGQLPFRAYNGRRDRRTMSKIINGRARGDISGVQTKMGGPIIYDQHLPSNVVMSPGLRTHVEGIITILFDKETSFKQFFDAAKAITSFKRIIVFHYSSTQLINNYLPPNTTYESFQQSVEQITSIAPSQQLLLFQNLPFSAHFSAQDGFLVLRENSNADPVFLFSHYNLMPPSTGLDNRIFNFPDVSEYNGLTESLWQPCQESLQYILRAVTCVIDRQFAIYQGARMLIQHITRKFDRLDSSKSHATDLIQSQLTRLNTLQLLVSFVNSSNQSQTPLAGLEDFHKESRSIKKLESRLVDLNSQSQATSDKLNQLVDFWLIDKPGCKPEDCCLSQVNAWIREVAGMKEEERKGRSKDEENLQKEKLTRAMRTCKRLVEEHCQHNCTRLFQEFRRFMSEAWAIVEELGRYEGHFSSLMEALKSLQQEGSKADDERRKKLKIPTTLPSSNITPSPITPTNPVHMVIETKRFENRESHFMRQLISMVSDKKGTLLKEMLPLAEENNTLACSISQTLVDWMSHNKLQENN